MGVALTSVGRKLRPSTRAKVTLPAKRVDPFYQSPEWLRLVAEIKAERGHRCEDPHCCAVHTATTRIFYDHLQERRDRPDLALVKSNIMGRCGSSHTRVTAARRARRLGGVGVGG